MHCPSRHKTKSDNSAGSPAHAVTLSGCSFRPFPGLSLVLEQPSQQLLDAAEDPTQDMNRPEPSGDEPLDLSEPEDLGEGGPFEERSAPKTKADLLGELKQRADRRTGRQEAEQRQIDPWSAQPPQRRGHGR